MASPTWPRSLAGIFLGPADARIYAIVRIAFATVALLNLVAIWPDRHVLFSDSGLLDPEVARGLASPVYASVFQFIRSETAVTCYLATTALAMLMLLSGVGTRAAALWVFAWHVSYSARAPLAFTGWDSVLRSFSFLVLVSPAGSFWSLPALIHGATKVIPANVPQYGLVLMRLQVLVIYWQAVLRRLMSPDPYWSNGEFLSYFFLSHNARWPGRWVLEYEGVFLAATHVVQLAEFTIPLLLWARRTRWWGMLLGFCLHAGISVFAHGLGLFFLAMMMSYAAFLRAEDVEWLARKWRNRLAA